MKCGLAFLRLLAQFPSLLMTPEYFTEQLRDLLGDSLVSVVLYGSATTGERSEKYSDYNLMVVCSSLGLEELDLIRPLTARWADFGNPPPLLFTWKILKNSSDVFPIELLDMKENHVILHGEDVLKRLPISHANMRFQLEHELKGKLIQLRERYLLTDGSEEELAGLLITTLSTFQILLRGGLRFFEVTIPFRKREAVRRFAMHAPFELAVFDEIQELKDGKIELEMVDVRNLFQRFLQTVENAADLIHEIGHRRG